MASIEVLKTLIRRVPGLVWFAVGGCLLAAFWMQQHDARIRQQAGLQQLRKETSTEVAALRRQAAENMEQANVKNAQAVAKLEQRRQQLDQQNRQLAAQLARLRQQAQIQAGEVATLPISEIVTREATQLGLKAGDIAVTENQLTPHGVTNRQGKLQVTDYELPKAGEAAPHPAAGASTPFPRRGPGAADSADITHTATSAPPVEGKSVALPLTASGARKVEVSLVALNVCRAESNIQTRQLSNCQARAAADEAAIQRLNGSVASLNQALQAKDKILVQQQSEYKAELRAARGTFLGRLARVTEHVAIGVGLGVAIGVAVK